MPDAHNRVTVGVVTRNRPDALRACLASLVALGDALAEVIVVDDSGAVPLDAALAAAPVGITRVIRQRHDEGYIVARNAIVRAASTEAVLLMDDDAALIADGGILDALRLLGECPRIGAVACAMAEPNGEPWRASMQPAPVDYTCYVASFIGFAHLVRRSVFLNVGGYRESFHFYGEEKDLCIQLLESGFDVVYMPGVRVIHDLDPNGRNRSKYVRYVVRNDCLFALYNEPWPMLIVSVPVRLMRYFAMSRGLADRAAAFAWIVGDLARRVPAVIRGRRPVSWSTIRRWRHLVRTSPPFQRGGADVAALTSRVA